MRPSSNANEKVVSVQKRLLCTLGENDSAKRIVSRISNLVHETLGGTYKNTKLLFDVVHHSSKQPKAKVVKSQTSKLKQKAEEKSNGRPCSQKKIFLVTLLQRSLFWGARSTKKHLLSICTNQEVLLSKVASSLKPRSTTVKP